MPRQLCDSRLSTYTRIKSCVTNAFVISYKLKLARTTCRFNQLMVLKLCGVCVLLLLALCLLVLVFAFVWRVFQAGSKGDHLPCFPGGVQSSHTRAHTHPWEVLSLRTLVALACEGSQEKRVAGGPKGTGRIFDPAKTRAAPTGGGIVDCPDPNPD